jgi:NAD(P)-dependent dehydrogenase (short-subunit alcohol dehydrogenase family)
MERHLHAVVEPNGRQEPMDLGLAEKRALVTGGSRGIGAAIADGLAAEGVDVALLARSPDTLAAAQERIARHGGRVLAHVADTRDDAAVRRAVDATLGAFGGIDILVNAAAQPGGASPHRELASLEDDDLRIEIETKVLGYLRCARAVAPSMIDRGWGRIINIGGLAARSTGSTFGTIRNVAVAAMTKNLADELGPLGITVNVVHPGATVTERTPEQVRSYAARQGVSEQDAEQALGRSASIGRMVRAEEVADVVVFLASPRSVAINGEPISVGGGTRGTITY